MTRVTIPILSQSPETIQTIVDAGGTDTIDASNKQEKM